jgi:hypothetical protein
MALLVRRHVAIHVVMLEKVLVKLVTSPSPLKADVGCCLLIFPLCCAQPSRAAAALLTVVL